MNRRHLAVLLAGLALGTPALAQIAANDGPQIVRESTGSRRNELAEMELKPVPADLWSKLTAWSGEPLTAGDLDGKPVLVFAFASFQPASQRAASIAQQMVDRYGKDGLVVIGVHAPGGWNRAAALAEDRKLTFPMAHDSTGEFAKKLVITSMPDWYVIDRAGNLRYAAVAGSSVDAAVAEVTKETREQASDLPGLRRDREQKERTAKGRMTDIRQNFDLASIPFLPPGYVEPGEGAYEHVKWPKIEPELGKLIGMIDQQTNKQTTPELNFDPEFYYPSEPQSTGRAKVIYFWHPEDHRTFNPVMSKMDLLQRQYPRDLVVIGAMVPLSSIDPSRQQEMSEEDQAALQRKWQSFIKSRRYNHALAADFGGSSIFSINGAQGNVQNFPLPGAMVISTDGIIRWVGWSNTSDFNYAIDTILAVDPAVKARRAADQKYIENTQR